MAASFEALAAADADGSETAIVGNVEKEMAKSSEPRNTVKIRMKAQEIINISNMSIAWEFPKNVSRYILEKFMRSAQYFKIYFTPISELFEREELVCKAGNPRGFL